RSRAQRPLRRDYSRAPQSGRRRRLLAPLDAAREPARDHAAHGGRRVGGGSRSQLRRLPRVIFSNPYADTVAKLRVPCGFVLVAAFLWLSAPTLPSLAAGIPVSILGLALRAWAAGHLEKDSTLTVSGPYAWVRNPLYLGTLATAAGLVIASRRWELGILSAAVFVLIYLPVV